jgi:hypothetical protein
MLGTALKSSDLRQVTACNVPKCTSVRVGKLMTGNVL